MNTNKSIIIIFIVLVIAVVVTGIMAENNHDYRLDAIPNGYILYSGSEKIGFIPAGNSTLDSLIQNNNQ